MPVPSAEDYTRLPDVPRNWRANGTICLHTNCEPCRHFNTSGRRCRASSLGSIAARSLAEELEPTGLLVKVKKSGEPPSDILGVRLGESSGTCTVMRRSTAFSLTSAMPWTASADRAVFSETRRRLATSCFTAIRARKWRENRSYRTDRIQSVAVTTHPFTPRFVVEFPASGTVPAPPSTRRQVSRSARLGRTSSRMYTVRCLVCGKRFRRASQNSRLRPHKGPSGSACPGRTAYLGSVG